MLHIVKSALPSPVVQLQAGVLPRGGYTERYGWDDQVIVNLSGLSALEDLVKFANDSLMRRER